ncbi:uncharacterized protein LTR77_002437 [Saxophila tyrrhenica]|uniref:Enoyl reductase (ER) domain-containing protein n=1 Tax=Saxophila tyrrhenica TaxID=1690608 RepID=A0AAV9PN84_9PEZI|nr:hypothetical protein LTR77_002437 [Saxophila tyrrhenica]
MANDTPSTMFAWRKHKGVPEPIWEEIPVPQPSRTEVLVKMLASGVCRSDISLLANDKQSSWFREEYTLGHEVCGQITQLGEGVGETMLKEGDIVALYPVPGCRRQDCPECSRDLHQTCESGHHSGIGQDGFYAPYAVVDARAVVLVPSGVSPAVAAVATDAVTTAYHGIVRRAEVKKDETVLLFGLGGLGINALQIILNVGARVIVSDPREACQTTARSLGVPAEDIVPTNVPLQEFVRENGLENRIDTVLDFVGRHQTFEDGQQIVRRGGKILCIGTLDYDNTVHMKVGTRKQLSFIFSYGGQVEELEEVLQMIAKGAIRPVVEERPMSALPEVLKGLEAGTVDSRVALTHE